MRVNNRDGSVKTIRVVYVAGRGDVIGTFRFWKQGIDDPSEVAITYSSQFFDVCEELNIDAVIVTMRENGTEINEGHFTFINIPSNYMQNSVSYHINSLKNAWNILKIARKYHAEAIIVAGGLHLFALTPLAIAGVRVIPDLHSTLWPKTRRSNKPVTRVIEFLNGLFWRYFAWATVTISPECTRQVMKIAGRLRGPIHTALPGFRRERFAEFSSSPAWEARPFRLVYAGRIERSKGVAELLGAAYKLHKIRPGEIEWEVCGEGSLLEWLKNETQRLELNEIFFIRGKLEYAEMINAYERSHAVVVPTPSDCKEGLNKVVIEAVLTGRPVISSKFIPANELRGSSIIPIDEVNDEGIAKAVLSIIDNNEVYLKSCESCIDKREQFYDSSKSWGAAIRAVLLEARNSIK